MKTNKQNKSEKKDGSTNIVSELQNRTEQLVKAPETTTAPETKEEATPQSADGKTDSVKPYVNFAEREHNRNLSVEKVLEKLRRWMPRQYELAEVVGKWIWISFPEPPEERVRADLSQLGFHWNNTRKCWQHPCGQALPRGQQEPRDKYTTYFPSDQAAA